MGDGQAAEVVAKSVPKKDYYDDPTVPPATSLVVAVTAVILDDAGRVLMIQRTDNGLWAIPDLYRGRHPGGPRGNRTAR